MPYLANVTKLHPDEAGTYKQMLGALRDAPGSSTARNLDNDGSYCNALNLPGFDPVAHGLRRAI